MNFVSIFLKRHTYIFRKFLLSWIAIAGFSAVLPAASITSGFKALSIYDYFLAKKTFYRINKKNTNAYASYGLAVIYSRNDNPFFNLDSAVKYSHLSYAAYVLKPAAKELSGFKVDSAGILDLCHKIGTNKFQTIKSASSASLYDDFLARNYLVKAELRDQVVFLRDEIEYNLVIRKNHSDSTTEFINTHPESTFLQEALLLRQRQVYDEQTAGNTREEYIRFIAKYPSSRMLNSAYENLYKIYRDASDVKGLRHFVLSYPKAPQNTEAWKLLFSLSVTSFSNENLEKFLVEYPAFPFRNSILKELELNKVKLLPYE
ncbi:MAG: hypothetical protein K0S12_982, partial [Bacteroidetes bacterium]|nr:hypothetical protein [Bacteroidota bacterium]